MRRGGGRAGAGGGRRRGRQRQVERLGRPGVAARQAKGRDHDLDAQGQRDKLTAAGLSNAFVDGPVAVNGKQKYRVRVGPFPSREAAQAAQTRLRTLGFGGAFIASQ